jgi:hypothetical protein
MSSIFCPQVRMSADTSGAYYAGKDGDIVLIVDVIDMSTTIECAIEAGCTGFYGAAPDHVNPPVPVNPEKIGYKVGIESIQKKSPILIVSEPRWGTEKDLQRNTKKVVMGIINAGGVIEGFVPNLGRSTVELCDFRNRLVIGVTDSGGTAFDAAFNSGGIVLTGTVARTINKKGVLPALIAAKKAIEVAVKKKKNITVIAASANSLEDILAAQYITQKILEQTRR